MSTPAIEFAKPQLLSSMLISVTDINFGDRQRKAYPDIPELQKSLAANGQIQSIIVRPPRADENVEQPWVLVAGGRRLTAAMLLGWKEIRADNIEALTPWKHAVVELEENIQRAAMTWQEEVDAKAQIDKLYRQENPGWNATATAQLLKMDKGNLSRDLRLATALEQHPELAKASSKKAALKLLDTKLSLKASAAKQSTINMDAIHERIVCADALDFLDRFDDDSVDLFLSDLPFGIDYFDRPATDRENGGGISKFDDSLPAATGLINQIFAKLARKVKPTGWICVMISEDLRWAINSQITIINTQKQAPGKKLAQPPQPWIWYRPNSRNNPTHGHIHAKSMYDIIIPINAGKAVLREACANIIMIDSDYENRIHAHQKPVALGEELIRRFTLPGDLVVDVTMGSGAFLAAAAKTHRQFAGCDLNEDIVPLARGFVSQFYTNTKVGVVVPPPSVNGLTTEDELMDFYGNDPNVAYAMADDELEDLLEDDLEDPNEPDDDEDEDEDSDEEDDDLSDLDIEPDIADDE